MLDVKKREIGKKFLELLNSKPVIGALIFIMLSLVGVFAANVVVQNGALSVESNFNASNILFVNSTSRSEEHTSELQSH